MGGVSGIVIVDFDGKTSGQSVIALSHSSQRMRLQSTESRIADFFKPYYLRASPSEKAARVPSILDFHGCTKAKFICRRAATIRAIAGFVA
jgi:hypothetical protein